jgi:hypothetical protein
MSAESPAEPPYGLDPANPVLCGGGVQGEIDYLHRLRCPAGTAVRFDRQGSLRRTGLNYLDRPDVAMTISRARLRRIAQADPSELPLDAYRLVCECGQHHELIFVDMYFRGPELPLGKEGWTLSEPD